MSDLDLIREASHQAWRLRGEPTPELTDLLPEWDYSDEDIARLWLIADEWRLAVESMCKVIGDEWVKRWKDRGNRGVEVDGYLVGAKKGYTKEECVDPDGFFTWFVLAFQNDPGLLRKILNPNQVRKGSLPPAARDSFFEKETVIKPDSTEQPSVVPVDVLEQAKRKKELTNG